MVEGCTCEVCGIGSLLGETDSENAQCKLRDSVRKSLYADGVKKQVSAHKKLGGVPKWEHRLFNNSFRHCYFYHAGFGGRGDAEGEER